MLELKEAIFTAYDVRAVLDYDPITGVILWRYRSDMRKSWNTRYADKTSGSINWQGYRVISLSGRIFYAHRLAWIIKTGSWPESQLDHINGIKFDNRIVNLRLATHSQNNFNVSKRLDNKSGFKGVYFNHETQKWRSQIRFDGKRISLGTFTTPQAAHDAYAAAAAKYHDVFARFS